MGFKKIRENLNFQENNIYRIAIMHGKVEFAKFKGSVCNISIEATNICHILPRPADSNILW